MNTRERFLAIILVMAIVLVVGGFLGYQFVWSPYNRHTENAAKLRLEVDELEVKKMAIEAQQHIYETKTKKMSLPLDTSVAQREYNLLIDRMLRQAKFTSPQMIPHKEDSKTDVPLLAGKKPAYTKLNLDVEATGDLMSIVDFLYSFYRQPLLHKIVKFTVYKSTAARGRELGVKLSIQALVLDRADDRRTLLAPVPSVALAIGSGGATAFSVQNVEGGRGTPFVASNVLARAGGSGLTSEEYRRITGKNIFFDPPKAEPEKKEEKKEEKEPVAKEMDLGPYLGLVRVSHSDGKSTAQIFDRYNKHDYEIETNGTGAVKVTHYWYLPVKEDNGFVGEVRKKFTERPYLQFGTEEGGNLRRYTVHRVLESELLLETYDANRDKLMKGPAPLAFGGTASLMLPGKLHVWRIGNMLVHEDSKKAMKDLNLSWTKREALVRPLNLENDGDATINFTGDGDKPPEPKKSNGSSSKKGSKSGKGGNE